MPDTLTVPVSPRDHALGPESAPVTLVEYGDYECPDCLNAFPIVQDLIARLGPKLRFVFRHYPQNNIHPHASQAAMAAEAAGAQGKYWEMHEQLFHHQKELADLDLTHLALRLGLELYRFEADRDREIYRKRIADDIATGSASGVRGTPTFFINSQRYRGKAELEPMLAALESAGAQVPSAQR
jgi:protein-disulfide isomerase